MNQDGSNPQMSTVIEELVEKITECNNKQLATTNIEKLKLRFGSVIFFREKNTIKSTNKDIIATKFFLLSQKMVAKANG
jgi:hypothetical protein